MKKGFTLIELLAVIIILAVVALIATPIVLDVVADAKDSARESKLKLYADNVKLNVSNSYLDNNGNINGKVNAETINNTAANCTNAYYKNGNVYLDNCTVDGISNLYFMDGVMTDTKPSGFDEAVAEFNVEPPIISGINHAWYDEKQLHLSVVSTGTNLHYKYYYKLASDTDAMYEEYTDCITQVCDINNLTGYLNYNVKVIASDDYGNHTEFIKDIGRYCFVAGTKVLTENGYTNIENIKNGDMVYTINLDTNERELNRVIGTTLSGTMELYEITINGSLIKATPFHEFYVVDKGWVKAYNLNVNDLLNIKGEENAITDIKYVRLETVVSTYNLAVENNHNYLVTESEVLVHNSPT